MCTVHLRIDSERVCQTQMYSIAIQTQYMYCTFACAYMADLTGAFPCETPDTHTAVCTGVFGDTLYSTRAIHCGFSYSLYGKPQWIFHVDCRLSPPKRTVYIYSVYPAGGGRGTSTCELRLNHFRHSAEVCTAICGALDGLFGLAASVSDSGSYMSQYREGQYSGMWGL